MRRTGILVAIIGLLGVVVAACGSTANDEAASKGRHSVVVRLLSDTRAARTVHVTSRTSFRGDTVVFSSDEWIDLERDRSSLRTVTQVRGKPATTVEFRNDGDVTFASVNAFAGIADGALQQYEWVRLRRTRELGSDSGRVATVSAFDVLDDLGDSATVTKVGHDTIGGVATTEYQLRFDRERLAQRLGVKPDAIIDAALHARMWVDGQDRLRRFEQALSSAPTTYDFDRYGDPVAIDMPRGADVYDGTREPSPLDLRPSAIGPWARVASGTLLGSTWTLWRAPAGDGASCWSFESTPDLNAGMSLSVTETVNGVKLETPQHDGHDAACEAGPGLGLLSQPMLLPGVGFTSNTDGPRQFVVGVAVAGATELTARFDDGTTQPIAIDPTTHVFAWSSAARNQAVQLRANLPDGRVVVCGEQNFPAANDVGIHFLSGRCTTR